MDTFFASNALAVVPGEYGEIWTTVQTESRSTPTSLPKLTLQASRSTQISQAAIPSGVTGGKIKFTVKDCFGNVKPISLDFQIKSNGVDPARKH